MSNSGLITQLRQKALDTLHESSELFERAIVLLERGDLRGSENAKELARAKRNDSVSLMREAESLDDKAGAPRKPSATASK